MSTLTTVAEDEDSHSPTLSTPFDPTAELPTPTTPTHSAIHQVAFNLAQLSFNLSQPVLDYRYLSQDLAQVAADMSWLASTLAQLHTSPPSPKESEICEYTHPDENKTPALTKGTTLKTHGKRPVFVTVKPTPVPYRPRDQPEPSTSSDVVPCEIISKLE